MAIVVAGDTRVMNTNTGMFTDTRIGIGTEDKNRQPV